jgi:hypothetical protein
VKKPFAIFTLTHNEALFLRVWCNYYCPLFSPENVFILDHDGQDDSVASASERHPGLHVSRVTNPIVNDHGWMRTLIQETQARLLEDYEVVVYAETDEFLIPEKDESLTALLERFRVDPDRQLLQATAWHPIHQFRSGEPPLVPAESHSLLESRGSMWRLPSYDKTLVTKAPLQYELGFHKLVGAEDTTPDPDLILLHAWMVDLAVFRQKRRLTDLDARQAFLTRRIGQFVSTGTATPIPARWKTALTW